jgi:xanthine dehydrogenase iron-sulfur cluster and FAD-binding subunit A
VLPAKTSEAVLENAPEPGRDSADAERSENVVAQMLEYEKEDLIREATDRAVLDVMNARNDEGVEGGAERCASGTAGGCHVYGGAEDRYR